MSSKRIGLRIFYLQDVDSLPQCAFKYSNFFTIGMLDICFFELPNPSFMANGYKIKQVKDQIQNLKRIVFCSKKLTNSVPLTVLFKIPENYFFCSAEDFSLFNYNEEARFWTNELIQNISIYKEDKNKYLSFKLLRSCPLLLSVNCYSGNIA